MSTFKTKIDKIRLKSTLYSVAGIYWVSEDCSFYCISENSGRSKDARIKFPGGNGIRSTKYEEYYFDHLKNTLKTTQFSFEAQDEIIRREDERFLFTNEYQRTLVLKFLEETGKYIGAFDEDWIWYEFVENNENKVLENPKTIEKDFCKIFIHIKELLYEPKVIKSKFHSNGSLLHKIEHIEISNFNSQKRGIMNPSYELNMSIIDHLHRTHLKPLPSFFKYIKKNNIKENNDFDEAVESLMTHHYPKG